jgi:hypothetical protein
LVSAKVALVGRLVALDCRYVKGEEPKKDLPIFRWQINWGSVHGSLVSLTIHDLGDRLLGNERPQEQAHKAEWHRGRLSSPFE